MKKAILEAIKEEALESATKYQLYQNNVHIEHARKEKRLKGVKRKIVKVPDEWAENKKYNPFYVLKHREKIAEVISKKIIAGTYLPEPPIVKNVPKKSGGTRSVSIYQLPDSAVSDKFYHDLLKKNKHRFSSFAYAYRNDRNRHFAIQDIANELTKSPRIFVAEFDFRNFFGSIEHAFIRKELRQNCFLISATEEFIIESFLKNVPKGIPLGTSISLFIANLICWRLDRNLEDEGLRFARYADDTIIWSKDYSKICRAFDIIQAFSEASGIPINYDKSDGISLLQHEGMTSEFGKSKQAISFLGYKLSVSHIGIRDSSVKNIKRQISYLLYKNLISPYKGKSVTAARLPTWQTDADFLTVISEIRRYLYGDLNEGAIKKYLNGTHAKLDFKGIMSFYPLINDEEQMRELDRWLISSILNALRKRKQLLIKFNYSTDFFPFNQNAESLLEGCKTRGHGFMRIPSFFRIFLAIQKGVTELGIDQVMHSDSSYDDDW